MTLPSRRSGVFMALTSAVLWGASGTCAQFLFQQRNVGVEWLMSVRMLGSGVLLLMFSLLTKNKDIWSIWTNRTDRKILLLFGLFGMLSVQYSYFATVRYSNAPTATVLQFCAPVIIAVYLAFVRHVRLRPAGYLAIVLAMTGTFLLVTHGDFSTLRISTQTLVFGTLCAFSTALYTLLPVKLLERRDPLAVITWGLLIGGLTMSCIQSPFSFHGNGDGYTVAAVSYITLFGTLLPFFLFLKAVQAVGGQQASLLTSAEPLSATLIALFWLKVPFTVTDWVATAMIIATVFLLSE